MFRTYLDTRPLIVQHPTSTPQEKPQLAIIAAMRGAPWLDYQTLSFPEAPCPLRCYVVVKKGGKELSYTSPAIVSAVPDPRKLREPISAMSR